MNYFEFYPGDYAKDTGHLSLSEHGAFLMLLSAYYSTEAPLPADLPSLYRIARAMTGSEQKAVQKVADFFFPVGPDGKRRNGRADREILKAQKRITIARSNGKLGGRRKEEIPAGNPAGNPTPTQPEPSGQARHTPHEEPKKEQELPPTAGAFAPIPADPIFGTGLAFLVRKSVPEHSARAFLGLLRKELRDDLTVAELLGEAERIDASHPQAWLRQAAKQRKLNAGERNGARNIGSAGRAEQLAREGDERDARREREQLGLGLGFDAPGGFA